MMRRASQEDSPVAVPVVTPPRPLKPVVRESFRRCRLRKFSTLIKFNLREFHLIGKVSEKKFPLAMATIVRAACAELGVDLPMKKVRPIV